jgi:hypothetical protein
MTKGNMLHAYLGYSIVAIQQQIMAIGSLIKEISEKSISATDSIL